MKYFNPFLITMSFSLLGEILCNIIPVSLPASIYGLVGLFLALTTKIVKVEELKIVSRFLIEIMPFLFVAPAVQLLEYWGLIYPNILPLGVIVFVSTAIVFAVSGTVTRLLRKGG